MLNVLEHDICPCISDYFLKTHFQMGSYWIKRCVKAFAFDLCCLNSTLENAVQFILYQSAFKSTHFLRLLAFQTDSPHLHMFMTWAPSLQYLSSFHLSIRPSSIHPFFRALAKTSRILLASNGGRLHFLVPEFSGNISTLIKYDVDYQLETHCPQE